MVFLTLYFRFTFSQVLPKESLYRRTIETHSAKTRHSASHREAWMPPFQQTSLHGIVCLQRKHRETQRDIEYGGNLLNRLILSTSSLLFKGTRGTKFPTIAFNEHTCRKS